MNNKYRFKVLKCGVFCVFLTFYKLQNSLKSPPRMQEIPFQGLYISKFSRGSMPPEPPKASIGITGKNKTTSVNTKYYISLNILSALYILQPLLRQTFFQLCIYCSPY